MYVNLSNKKSPTREKWHKNVDLTDKKSQHSEKKSHKIENLSEKKAQTGEKRHKNVNLSDKMSQRDEKKVTKL